MTLKDTPKEAKLHEGSASSVRLSGVSFSRFHLTLPKRGDGYFSSPPTLLRANATEGKPRGQSGCFTPYRVERLNYTLTPHLKQVGF